MKANFNRYLLAVLLCNAFIIGEAQIIDEDFSGLENAELVSKKIPPSLADWEFSPFCKGTFINDNVSKKALKLEGSETTDPYIEGYAITKKLDYEGGVYLSFIHSKTNKGDTNVKLDLTIIGGGRFADNNSDTRTIPVTTYIGDATATSESFLIIGTTTDTKIKFSTPQKQFIAIDNVKVLKATTLSESINNDGTISDLDNNLVTIETVRTLTGGIWNTLCLPFDVTKATMEKALGKNQDVQMRTYSSYADKEMTFSNANNSTIAAGTPFLIKLNTTITNPTFQGVTVINTPAQTVSYGDVGLAGTYNPKELNYDGTHLFITASNTLAKPAESTRTMRGLRAHLIVPSSFSPAGTRLVFADNDDSETTKVRIIPNNYPATTIYNLHGQSIKTPKQGLYVVDGKLILTK